MSEHFCWFLKKNDFIQLFLVFLLIFFWGRIIYIKKSLMLVKTSAELIHTRLSIHIPADLLKKYIIWSQSIWLASPTRSMILRCILFFQNKIKKSNKKVSEAHKTFLQRSISILIFHNKLFFLCWKESHLNSRGHSSIIQNYSLEMWGLYLMKLSCKMLQNFAIFL